MKQGELFAGFLISIIIFGLLPVWVIAILVRLNYNSFNWAEAIKDGGLFFFTSTTLASYVYTYIAKGERDGLISIFSLVAIFGAIIMIVFFTYRYSIALSNSQLPTFTGGYATLQTVGTLFSVAYALIIEAHIDGFKPKRRH